MPAGPRPKITAVGLTIVCVIGCGGGGSQTATDAGVQVRDSAGIEIVYNIRPLWDEADGWSVSPQPVLMIADGPDESSPLFQVRDAKLLSDGGVAVANGGSDEVFLYDPDGNHIGAFGREGEGPGEFTGLGELLIESDDTVVATDGSQRRLSIFDSAGTFVRSLPYPAEIEGHRIPDIGQRLDDGRYLAVTSVVSERGPDGRVSAGYVLLSQQMELAGELGILPAVECASPLGEPVCAVGWFQGSATVAASDSTVWYGFPSAYSFFELNDRGDTLRIVRRDWELIPVGEADLERLFDFMVEERDRSRETLDRLQTIQVLAETMPVFERAMTDALGNLWVAEYNEVAPVYALGGGFRWSATIPWSVFTPNGRWLGTLELPAALNVTQITGDRIVGIWEDDLEIETVRVYALER